MLTTAQLSFSKKRKQNYQNTIMQKILILTFIGFLNFNLLPAQNTIDSLRFPAAWEGEWRGELEIFNAKGKVQSLPMELHILPIDTLPSTWTWTIIYGEDKEAGKRAYELHEMDKAKGLYLIDEKNTIKLEGYLLGEKFYQRFEVMGNLLMTSTEMVSENELHWEIISGKLEPVSTTGGEAFKGEEIPPVKAYGINVFQRAILRR